MTRFAILGDAHWGARNDLNILYNHFDKFYKMFVDDLVANDIKVVFQLGDLFDRRKYINFRTLHQSKQILFNRLRDAGIEFHTLVGNHDAHFRESLQVNSQSLVLGEYNNIHIYDNPTTINFDSTSIDIIPWICKDNEKEVMDFIAKSKSDICMGHFEIATFAMYRGVESHEGLPVDMFAKYEKVLSGHYHTKSNRENIVYVGTPYEMTWQDYNDPKGYHIFDTESRDLSFYENPYTIFVRVDYDDSKDLVDPSSLDLADRFVKVVVTNKTDLYKFDQFMSKMYTKGCYEVKVIEDLSEFQEGEISEEINLEDTMDVLSNYIDSIDTDADKDKIKSFMKSLYIEAINMDTV